MRIDTKCSKLVFRLIITWFTKTWMKKSSPQRSDKKPSAQNNKITWNYECMLFKCFKSKWQKCYVSISKSNSKFE